MMNSLHDDYQRLLESCVKEGGKTSMRSAHPINQAMVNMWADALIDKNPVYVDEAAAKATGRSGVIAPPTMIQAWSMPSLSGMANSNRDLATYAPYWDDSIPRLGSDSNPTYKVFKLLAEKNFSNTAATNLSHVYHRESSIGDHITCTTSLAGVTDEKRTAMGVGHFITTRMEYTDQEQRPVATQLWTILRFRTYTKDEQSQNAARRKEKNAEGASVVSKGNSASSSGSNGESGQALSGAPVVGQLTQRTVIPITATFIICTAIATHDFYAIHHDDPWVKGLGQPGIFSNILTTTGLTGGVFTKWAGPNARIESVDLRLLVPNYAGDTLSLVGQVKSVEGKRVVLEVTGTNRLGAHVHGTVTGTI